MASEYETLRWPTNLDRAAIEARLVQVRDAARQAGLDHLVSLFEDPSKLSAGQIGANVLSALDWLQKKPEQRAITMQLEMIAMNLKNLR